MKGIRTLSISDLEQSLNGSWVWYKTVYDYIGPGTPDNTPQSCSCSRKIIFRNKNVLEYYSNDTLISKDAYWIERHPDAYDVGILRSEILQGNIRLKNDTLGIGWFGFCATLDFFTKVKE
jgi:hypothetical protein